jgi:hypothetical protein
MSQQIYCSPVRKATRLMFFAEIITVSCENLTYDIRPLYLKNAELLNITLVVGFRRSSLYLVRKCVHYISSGR